MNIWMTGIDHERAEIAVRERFSFVEGQVSALDAAIAARDGIEGCVLLSTCNRTELYLHAKEGTSPDPAALLCAAAGIDAADCREAFVTRAGLDAARHLCEVAGGLRSQIVGEDQIVTQVRRAITLARGAHAADAVLETLFRCAVTAGKEVRAETRLIGVPRSAAAQGAVLAETLLGGLAGCRAVVIGNGEMGRLACGELTARGAAVTVTLRSYRHGETVVPRGCSTVAYDRRMEAIEGADLVVSATTSPHYTLTAAQLAGLARRPRLIVDLALPRDVEPAAGELTMVRNMDDLGRLDTEDAADRAHAQEIIEKHLARFTEWSEYRDALPVIERIKQAACARVCTGEGDEDAVCAAVEKTVDLLLGGMKQAVTPALLEKTLEKICRCLPDGGNV